MPMSANAMNQRFEASVNFSFHFFATLLNIKYFIVELPEQSFFEAFFGN